MQLVILDRDGVINQESDDFIKSPDEWEPIPGSLEALARLHRSGVHVVVVSNQSGLARGLYDIQCLNEIHQKMDRLVHEAGGHIDAIFFCPHGPEDACECRKPMPGLFQQIATRLHVDLATTPFVGDRLSDVEAARMAGAIPILVRTGRYQENEVDADELLDVAVYADLAEYVSAYLEVKTV